MLSLSIFAAVRPEIFTLYVHGIHNELVFCTGAGVPVTSPLLYSAGHTDDTRQALMYIAQKYPHAPLLGIGFSLGANVITRYLAEEGANSRLRAACILACVRDRFNHNPQSPIVT